MGKSKKDKKNRQESDPEDELVTQTAAISIKDGEGKNEKGDGAPQKQKKKDKKKKDKGKVESDDEEDGITALAQNIGVTGSKKQKPTGFSAFQMLQDDDDDEAGSMSESDGEEEDKLAKKPSTKETTNNVQNEDEPMETSSAPAQKNKKKKGKKGKQEEEDIDAILAEIEKPAEKEGKKKKKGKKEEKDEGNEAEETPEPTPQPAENEKGGPKLIDFSAMTQEEIAAMFDEEEEEEDDRKKKKKKKKGKKGAAAEEEEKEEEGEEQGEEGQEEQEEGTVKTAAQKKKEKKERQRLQKLQQKKKGPQKKEDADDGEKEDKKEEKEVKEDAKVTESAEPKKEQSEEKAKEPSVEKTKEPSVEKEGQAEGEEKGSDDEGETDKKKKKRDKKKKKDEKEKEKEVKKKPGSKQLKLIQEMQQLKKEEEERLIREEEEKERRIEEARRLKEEEEKKKAEKKEKEKQKKKERIERAKAEGRYLTPKQKEAQKRAQQLVEALQAQGVNVPLPGQAAEDRPKKKPLYTRKKKPQKQQETDKSAGDTSAPSSAPETPLIEENKLIEDLEKQTQEAAETKVEEVKEEPKEAWDMSSGDEEEEEEEEDKEDSEPKSEEAKKPEPVEISVKDSKEEEDQEEEEEEENEEESEEGSSEEEESSEEESSDESSSEEDEKLTPAEKTELRLKKTRERIKKRKEANEAKRTTDHLRAPVVCVLGHVDTGKTKILDKLRRTHVQDGEAGGITQQIGATNVPADCILEQTRMCKEFAKKELKIPGLLIIDTPGHESFSNLRTRGSGLCDIAVLVVDIMHGLEPQTIESINLLKSRKTPFVIALNKIDRLYGWQSSPGTDVHSALKKQKQNTKLEFDERAKSVIVQMAEQGLNTALFYENKNPREYISLVPTSAHSGDGMGSLIALICELCQSMLAKRLAYSEELQAVAMEVKAIPGLGTTVDVILVNGKMREGQQIVLAGTEGPIVTQIRGLLMPQPLRELRVKNAYTRNKEVVAAQGVKVIAKDMEKALAGLPVFIAENQDEVEVYRQEIEDLITDVLDSIKVQEKGVYVQASTLGSLEALLEFLKTSKIPFAGINIGPVHKRDVMKASTMLERDSQYAVILAFDVKVERDAQEFADSVGVRIFTADIIYHLFDAFMGYREELKRAKQDEFKHLCVFPAKLKILPNCVFNSRDPIVVGVVVEAGFIKEGTPLCVPAKQFVDIGRVSSIEFNHKPVEIARKGNEVCIKIDPIPGDAPKMVGRHFEETDQLVSKISRQSIDVVKNYFRDDMSKTDWQLIMELKKTFSIL